MPTLTFQHYLDAWGLSDPKLLAETPTSHVYTVTLDSETVVLKLLTPVGVDDEQSGAVALRCFDGHGAVRLLRHDAGAHLLEYIAGDDLVPLVRRDEDAQATAIIGDVLNRLHNAAKDAPADGLVPLKRRFRSLFERAVREGHLGAQSIFVRAAALTEDLLAYPRAECVLHGDIHHENIRHSPARGWLAIDPKGMFGERTYDAANTLCNPYGMPALVENAARLRQIAAILAEEMGVDRARVLAFAFAYACLSASWSLDVGHAEDAGHALRIAATIETRLL